MALFNKEEIIRPLTLAVLAIMCILVIVIRFTGSGKGEEKKEDLTRERFAQIIESIYPTKEEIRNATMLALGKEYRRSDDITFIARDGYLTKGYLSKPEGAGPFPFIIIVPDPFVALHAEEVSQQFGELYATAFNAVVLVLDARDDMRGENDVTDLIAAMEWQDRAKEIQDQPQILIGIGYGSWMIAKASETIAPEYIVMLSPVVDFSSTHTRETIYPLFARMTKCVNADDQETCIEELTTIMLPQVPTYVQYTTSEEEDRAADLAFIQQSTLSDIRVDSIDAEVSLRTASYQSTLSVLAESLSKVVSWYDARAIDVSIEQNKQ